MTNMLNDQNMEKLKCITQFFGIETELTKLSEEVGELLNEGYKSHFSGIVRQCEVEDECADVLVILAQIMIYFDLDLEEVQRIFNAKIDRTTQRIDNGWYDKHR